MVRLGRTKHILIGWLVLSIGLLVSCATYYQRHLAFQQKFIQGDFKSANEVLDKSESKVKDKDQLLFYLQKGVVLQMLGQFEESNRYFEEAYFYTEDFQKNYLAEAASFLTNPSIKPYQGEDHEVVLMHYFKIINYLNLGQLDEALVECRRINNKLNLLNDRYEDKKNRYKQDAFSMNIMGMAFEASGDVNNAFIAYRNAYKVYDEEYRTYFGTDPPQQLKKDILRTAYLNGFNEELRQFEKKFGIKYEHRPNPGGELVVFWHNGMGPVKDEWSINFVLVKGSGGGVTFVNEEYGLSFPFFLDIDRHDHHSDGLGDLKFVRAAFPRYLERKPYYQNADIVLDGKTYDLEMGENINAIAFATLQDRMLREFGTALLRLALKQAAEIEMRKENENLGALLSVVNAISEKADTRNWQTLPYSISYARIPLEAGSHKVYLSTGANQTGQQNQQLFDFHINPGQTVFHVFRNVECIPLLH